MHISSNARAPLDRIRTRWLSRAAASGKLSSPSLPAYWNEQVDTVLTSLHSSRDGLRNDEAVTRLAQYGHNALRPHAQASALRLFIAQFRSPLVLILLFATLVSASLQEWTDALITLAILLGSASLGFIQEHRASRAVEELQSRTTIKATVLRDGLPRSIPSEDIVPGDVVLLSAGSLVPADGLVIEARDFFVSQAALTGETFPVAKETGIVPAQANLAERTNCVFMGTTVRTGSARVLLVETGLNTAFGQIAERLSLREPQTEFERGIHDLSLMLTRVTIFLVFGVFVVHLIFQKPIIDSLLFSIALAVGMAPELLPAIISVTLSEGARKMASQGVIVRRLASLEDFGSMDVLCTDKTGTLTEGVIRLDAALGPLGEPSQDVFPHAYWNAKFQTGLTNPLDEAILAYGQPDLSNVSKLDEIPYDFVRKRLSVVVQTPEGVLLVTKGALDNVLDVCSQVVDAAGVVGLVPARRDAIRQVFAGWSAKGYRVLGLASKVLPRTETRRRYSRDEEQELTFEGLLIFFDALKPDAAASVADLADLGVALKIITGDNRLVALHVAQKIGLDVSGVITGADLNALSDEALLPSAERVNLFAEVDPNQKERIILALKKRGHVVGFMGDGINDATALHTADVGISVELAVDVAKQAADFVLLERDLGVLHQGIILGRRTFANSIKYIFTTVSANFGNMFSMAAASIFLPFLPLLPKQILLNNFLSDFPSMTIATDNVDDEWVRKPRQWDIQFIQKFMVVFGIVSSFFDFLLFGVLLFVVHASVDEFRTGWFVESLLTELLLVLVVRTWRPFFKSRPGKYLLASTIIVALLTLYVPYSAFSASMGFVPLPLHLMAVIVGITLLYLIATEITKRIFYKWIQWA